MFDTTIVEGNKTQYVPYEKTVHEHKAPTDKSIGLLNEFKTQILEDTLSLIEVKNTEFDFIARYGQHPGTFEHFAVIKFMFNGKEITKKLNVGSEKLALDQERVVHFFITEYKRLIAECIEEAFMRFAVRDLVANKNLGQEKKLKK